MVLPLYCASFCDVSKTAFEKSYPKQNLHERKNATFQCSKIVIFHYIILSIAIAYIFIYLTLMTTPSSGKPIVKETAIKHSQYNLICLMD